MSEKQLIDRGLVLEEEIRVREKELDEIEEKLSAIALRGEQIPLEDEERDGRQYIAGGSEKTVPIVITADVLMKSFQGGSAVHERVEMSAGTPETLKSFFKRKVIFERIIDDGKIFRRKAREILGEMNAAKFITACVARDKAGVPKSAIRIEWQRAQAKH